MNLNMIIMAAGNSSRFALENKLLAEFHGKPLVYHILSAVREAGELLAREGFLVKLILVSRYESVMNLGREQGFYCVWSEESKDGISYTIKNGIKACDGGAFIFFTADQPCLKGESIVRLIKETIASGLSAGRVSDGEREGNPVIFMEEYREALIGLSGDMGGARLLKGKKYHVCQIEARELCDADTREAFLELSKLSE